ncbi:MAG: hypothetical protein PHV34_22385 [Verrucomicrobiae bacterium]|nr:hypothetical protein [Verrucomicrobiae bacterium]
MAALAQGNIPKDCDLLLIPSEPFMSGLIDAQAAKAIENWVNAGHALLVFRAATCADIYGEERGHSTLRKLTGIDYVKSDCPKEMAYQKTLRGQVHPVSRELPETIDRNQFIDDSWLVQFTHLKYDRWQQYYATHPAEWFLGTQMSRSMIRRLLPAWKTFPENGARVFDGATEVLYQCADTPLVAVKSCGKGRIAYLAREFNLSQSFGHLLLSNICFWLAGASKKVVADNSSLDVSLRKSKDGKMVCLQYNPTAIQQQSAICVQPDALEDKSEYLLCQMPFDATEKSRHVPPPAPERFTWKKDELCAGYKADCCPRDLSMQYIIPYCGVPLLFSHYFCDPSTRIEGACSLGVTFIMFGCEPSGGLSLQLTRQSGLSDILEVPYEKQPFVFSKQKIQIVVSDVISMKIVLDGTEIVKFEGGAANALVDNVVVDLDKIKRVLTILL